MCFKALARATRAGQSCSCFGSNLAKESAHLSCMESEKADGVPSTCSHVACVCVCVYASGGGGSG